MVKNVFVLPGIVVAVSLEHYKSSVDLVDRLHSDLPDRPSNYVINMVLEAPFYVPVLHRVFVPTVPVQ